MSIFRQSTINELHSKVGQTCHIFDQDTHLTQYSLRFGVFHLVMAEETEHTWEILQNRKYQEKQYTQASHVRDIYQSHIWGLSHFASLQNPTARDEARCISLLLKTGELTHSYKEKIERGIQLFVQTADHLPLTMENLDFLDEQNFFAACMQLLVREVFRQKSLPTQYRDPSVPENILLYLENKISSDRKSFDWKNYISSSLMAFVISEIYQTWSDLDLSCLYFRGSIDADFVEALYQQGAEKESPICCAQAIELATTEEMMKRLIPLLCENHQLNIAYDLLSVFTFNSSTSKSAFLIFKKHIDMLEYEAAFQVLEHISYEQAEVVPLFMSSLHKNTYPSVHIWNTLERCIDGMRSSIQYSLLVETYIFQEKANDRERAEKSKEKILLLSGHDFLSIEELEALLQFYVFTTQEEEQEKIEQCIKRHFKDEVQKEDSLPKRCEYFNKLYQHAPHMFDLSWIDTAIHDASRAPNERRSMDAVLQFLYTHSLFQESWCTKIERFYSDKNEKESMYSLEDLLRWFFSTGQDQRLERWISSVDAPDKDKKYGMVKIFIHFDKLQQAKAYIGMMQDESLQQRSFFKIIEELISKERAQDALEYVLLSSMQKSWAAFDVGYFCILNNDFEQGIEILTQSLNHIRNSYSHIIDFEEKLLSSIYLLHQNNRSEEAWNLIQAPIYESQKIAILVRLASKIQHQSTAFIDTIISYLLKHIEESTPREASNICYQLFPILRTRFGDQRIHNELTHFFSIVYHKQEQQIQPPQHLSFLQTVMQKEHSSIVEEHLIQAASNKSFHLIQQECMYELAKKGQDISPYLSASHDAFHRQIIKEFASQDIERSFELLEKISDNTSKVLSLFDVIGQIAKSAPQKAENYFAQAMAILLEKKIPMSEEVQELFFQTISILGKESQLHELMEALSLDASEESIYPYVLALQFTKKHDLEFDLFWKECVEKARISEHTYTRFQQLALIAKGIQKANIKEHMFTDLAVLLEEERSQLHDRRLKLWATRDLCELYTSFGHTQNAETLALGLERGRPRVHNSPLPAVVRLLLRQKQYAQAEALAKNIRKTREKIPAFLDVAEAYMQNSQIKESQEQVNELLRIYTPKDIQPKDRYRLSVLLFNWDRQEDFISLFESLSDEECANTLISHLSYDTEKRQEKCLVHTFFSIRRNEAFLSKFIPQYIPKVSNTTYLKQISIHMPFDFITSRKIALQLYTVFYQNQSWGHISKIEDMCPQITEYIDFQSVQAE